MKKFMMTLAAVLCCAMTTAVFIACGGDDDVTTPPASGKYQYWVESMNFDISLYDFYEDIEIKAALNKAVGLNEANVFEKTYNSRKDDEMKAACEAVMKRYTNPKSLYLVYKLKTNDGEYGKEVVVADLVGGKSVYTPCVKVYMKESYNTSEFKAVYDALRKLKTHADSLRAEEIKTEANARKNNIVNDFLNVLKIFKGKNGEWDWWKDDETVAKYNAAYFDQVAAPHLNDSLAYDVTITIEKWKLPSDKTEQVWSHTFKANYSYKN